MAHVMVPSMLAAQAHGQRRFAVGAAAETVGGALFGTALAVLVFLFAAGRILLLLAAWTATSAAPVVTGAQPIPGSAPAAATRSAEP